MTAAILSPKTLRTPCIDQACPESGLGLCLLPARICEKKRCPCCCMSLLLQVTDYCYCMQCTADAAGSAAASKRCGALALRQASTVVRKRCCEQALSQAREATSSKRCRKQESRFEQALLAALLLQARAPLLPRSRSSPLRTLLGQRRRRRAIFSLWRRCLHSECRGAQDRPHFCLLVLGAWCCLLLLQLAAASCTTSARPGSAAAAAASVFFFQNVRIQYSAFFRLLLCACPKVFNCDYLSDGNPRQTKISCADTVFSV